MYDVDVQAYQFIESVVWTLPVISAVPIAYAASGLRSGLRLEKSNFFLFYGEEFEITF